MIVVLTGAPGAGKGTQADLLAQRLGFRKVSTGDALRRQVKLQTEVGKKADALMSAGRLVPDDVLLDILKTEVGDNGAEKILLDGYPRNVAQAATLKNAMHGVHPVKAAIHLDVDREELIGRLSGRRVCEKCGATFHVDTKPPQSAGICDACGSQLVRRSDDDPKKIAVRLDVYERDTKPILDFYRQEDLYHRVNGSGDLEAVYGQLAKLVEGVTGSH